MLIGINIFHFVIILLLFGGIIYIVRRPSSKLQVYLLILSICSLVTVVGYTIEINADNLETAISGLMVCYLALPFALYSLTYFVAERYGYTHFLKKWFRNALLLLCPVPSALVFTCEYHSLYFTNIDFVSNGNMLRHLEFGHGIFYHVYLFLLSALLICDVTICVVQIKKSKTKFDRSQALCILGLLLSSCIGFLVYKSGITNGYDTTIVGTFIGCCIMYILFFRYNLFDVVEDAKEHALNISDDGIAVLKSNGRVEYASALMKKAFPCLAEDCSNNCLSILHDYANEKKVFSFQGRYYNVKEIQIEQGGRYFGSSIELHDITDNYLHSRRLEEEVEDRTKEIKKIQRKITISFANIVEARDKGTGNHTKRTGAMVGLIARTMKKEGSYKGILTENYITMLEETAALHDLGKISIPDNILLKPGILTDDEFEQMKNHTIMGKELIEKALRGVENDDYVTMAEDISLYHHERWDGHGYPYGISGVAIPLCARIMSIADVYDALRSDRCYKSAMSHEEACEIILSESGHQFDPAVVSAFFANIDKIEQLMLTSNK